jgi:hypothetical protein
MGNNCSQSQAKKELGVAYIKPIQKNPINIIVGMISLINFTQPQGKIGLTLELQPPWAELVTLVFNLENYIFRYNHQLGKEPTPTNNLPIMNIRLGIYHTIT